MQDFCVNYAKPDVKVVIKKNISKFGKIISC